MKNNRLLHVEVMMAQKLWCGLAGLCVAASISGSVAWAQQTADQQAEQLLNAGLNAWNNHDLNTAADRFGNFVRQYPTHKDVARAQYGLGLCALYTGDAKTAGEQLAAATKVETLPDRHSALFYLGLARRQRALQMQAEAIQRPDQAATLRAQAVSTLDDAAAQFAACAKIADATLAQRARCEWADVLLRTEKPKEVLATLDPVLKAKESELRPLGLFLVGQAHLAQKNYLEAGKALSQLAPFTQEFGLQARYLLARVHHLSGERPEAQALYHAVIADFAKVRKAAEEELRKGPAIERRAYLEMLRASERGPEFVQRAAFYLGSLQGELGQVAEAIEKLRPMAERDASFPLTREAQLRLGQLYLQAKNYDEANRWLEQARQDKALSDQATWLVARVQLARGDATNAASMEQQQRAALETLRAAIKAATDAAKTDPEAPSRRVEMMLESGHLMMALKQFKEAALQYGAIASEFANDEKQTLQVEEARERHVTALYLSGQNDAARQAAAVFEKAYPNSVLMSSVLYRQAEAAYLAGAAAANDPAKGGMTAAAPLFEQAIGQFRRVAKDFSESPFAQYARLGIGMSFYRQGKYSEAAEALAALPEGERLGDLIAANYLQADALLRTLPPEGDDALSAAKMLQQTDQVSRLLSSYAAMNEKAPTAPDAALKYGYVQQRVATVLMDPAERRRNLVAARDIYDKVLASVKDGPVFASAVLEKGKTLALLNDVNNATAELRRFTQDPLRQTSIAPLAIVRLSSLLRAANKPQEAVDAVKAARDAYEQNLLKDDAKKSWAAMLQYEHASALRETNKLAEARELFEAAAKNFAALPEGQNALWRAAQCRREELALAVAEAQRISRTAGKPEDADAAKKLIEAAPKQTLEASKSLEEMAAAIEKKASGSEAHLRILYELTWHYRLLGEAQVEALQIKLRRDALERLRMAAQQAPNDVAAGAGERLQAPEPSQQTLPLQPYEQKAISAYEQLIKAGREGLLVQQARIELGELHALRGQYDRAIAVLAAVLDGQAPPLLIDRARARLAAALIGAGQLDKAIAQAGMITRPNNNPSFAEARFLLGEAYVRKQEWAKAVEVLSTFRDNAGARGNAETTERAFLRLGQAYAEQGKWEESRQTYELQIQRFPNGILVHDARFGMGLALQKLNRHDEAAQFYAEVVKRTAAEVAARAQLQTGRARLEQKRFADAAKAYAVVPYTYDYPELSATAWFEAARAFAELKQPDEEAKALARLLKDYPQSTLAGAAQKRLSEIKK